MHSIRNSIPEITSLYLTNNSSTSDKVFAAEIKLRNDDDDVLLIEFKANTLKKGLCYDLKYQNLL